MFPTGSKLFLGLTGAALVGFVVYGSMQSWGALGVVGLASAVVALAFLAGVVLWARDGDVAAADAATVATAPAAQPAPRASLWPIVGAAGGVLLVIGLVTDRRWFVGGLAALFVATAEWMVQAWSERASSDRAYNTKVRGHIVHPLELPVLGAVGLAVLIYSFSRVMLHSSTKLGPVLFIALAALIAVFGFVVAAKHRPSKAVIVGICTVGALGLVTAGIWAGASGERPKLATEGGIFRDKPGQPSERSNCGADLTEADKDASGSLSSKSAITATVILRGNQLFAIQTGEQVDHVVLQKGSTANILFKNENGGSDPHRLTASYLVSALDSSGKPTNDLAVAATCTNAIKSGKVQLLTVTIAKSSAVAPAGKEFKLVVPDIPGAQISLEVI